MFEGYSADTRAGKFPLVSMGGRAEGLACANPGARTPIGASTIPPGSGRKYVWEKKRKNNYKNSKHFIPQQCTLSTRL